MTLREMASQETGNSVTRNDVTENDVTGNGVTGNDVTGNDATGNDVTINDVTGSGVTENCVTRSGIRRVGSGIHGEWCRIYHHVFSLFVHLTSYMFSLLLFHSYALSLTFLPNFTYHLFYLSFSFTFSLPPLRSLLHATACAV